MYSIYNKETTLAHQGGNTTFFDACSAGLKTTHSEVRFSKMKRVNDVVSATPPELCNDFSDRVTRLELDTPPLRFREKLRKRAVPST